MSKQAFPILNYAKNEITYSFDISKIIYSQFEAVLSLTFTMNYAKTIRVFNNIDKVISDEKLIKSAAAWAS